MLALRNIYVGIDICIQSVFMQWIMQALLNKNTPIWYLVSLYASNIRNKLCLYQISPKNTFMVLISRNMKLQIRIHTYLLICSIFSYMSYPCLGFSLYNSAYIKFRDLFVVPFLTQIMMKIEPHGIFSCWQKYRNSSSDYTCLQAAGIGIDTIVILCYIYLFLPEETTCVFPTYWSKNKWISEFHRTNPRELKCWSIFYINYFLRNYLMMQHQPIVKRVYGTHEWAHRPYQPLSAHYHCCLYKHRRLDERQPPKTSWLVPICTWT